MRTITIFILSILFVIVSAFGYLGAPKSKQEEKEESLRSLSNQVRIDEQVLRTHAKRIISGELKQNSGFITYPVSSLKQTKIFDRIHAITKDANNNVYFILTDSFVTFNVGFVLQNKNSDLLGDGAEPKITYKQKLFQDWWYYEAR